MTDIKPGDLVRLKTCSPRMVVEAIAEREDGLRTFYCVWSDINQHIQMRSFSEHVLEPIPSSERRS